MGYRRRMFRENRLHDVRLALPRGSSGDIADGVTALHGTRACQDHAELLRLLGDVHTLYPDFDNWLQRRLLDVERHAASCIVARQQGRAVGVIINTPKSRFRHKLSTIYVHPQHRGRRIGQALLEAQMRQWIAHGVRNYYVTVREERAEALVKLCWRYALHPIALERNRYGSSQHEVVLARRAIVGCVARS